MVSGIVVRGTLVSPFFYLRYGTDREAFNKE